MIRCRLDPRRRIMILISLAAMVASARVACAAEFRDSKTGLAVDPPAGFTARLGEIVVERASPATRGIKLPR
jgi:hypothetical protein